MHTPGQCSSDSPPTPPPIPDHTLHRRIGSGSYGEVWLGQSVLGEWRAVKIVRRDKFEEARPYEREFEGLSHYAPISLLHPSLLRVLHVGRNEIEGHFYCVMELADDEGASTSVHADSSRSENGKRKSGDEHSTHGLTDSLTGYEPRTLRNEIQRCGRLPFDECLSTSLELATALEHLHRHGLVHRDVKPSNVVFIRGEAKLADIGLVANYENTLSHVGLIRSGQGALRDEHRQGPAAMPRASRPALVLGARPQGHIGTQPRRPQSL